MALFRLCSSCRKEISCGNIYWVCSVSTCTRKRTGLFFCSVPCWEAHLPSMRHREAFAVEERAPSAEAWAREKAEESGPVQRPAPTPSPRPVMTSSSSAPAVIRRPAAPSAAEPAPSTEGSFDREVLIIASKLKKYIRDRSGFNTSDGVMDPLSDCLRAICDQAIRVAGADGRKTVLDRDILAVSRPTSR